MRPIAALAVGVLSLGLGVRVAGARELPIWTVAGRHAKGTAGLADLAERARAAVVHVRGESADGSAAAESDGDAGHTSIGTGFIINKDGYILTNEHVVRGVVDLRVRLFDGRECSLGISGERGRRLVRPDDAGVEVADDGRQPIRSELDADRVSGGRIELQ